jgi:hypothetical protein
VCAVKGEGTTGRVVVSELFFARSSRKEHYSGPLRGDTECYWTLCFCLVSDLGQVSASFMDQYGLSVGAILTLLHS